MVATDIAGRDIHDPAVLDAMRKVPREEFVPSMYRAEAHADHPLPIGSGQTISQPYIVAMMVELSQLSTRPSELNRVLEIGTGSGYGAAVLSELAAEVVTIERHVGIAEAAAATLTRLGYDGIEVLSGDGTVGHLPRAPYNAIIVTAASPEVPQSLLAQLADNGRLVIPLGKRSGTQKLVVYTRNGNDIAHKSHGGVRFVPLIGEEGFSS